MQGITAEEGPLALYKENRLSGRYRRVRGAFGIPLQAAATLQFSDSSYHSSIWQR